LKPEPVDVEAASWAEPQSNQRAIETQGPGALPPGEARPQSNQRGIETTRMSPGVEAGFHASIEPAWD